MDEGPRCPGGNTGNVRVARSEDAADNGVDALALWLHQPGNAQAQAQKTSRCRGDQSQADQDGLARIRVHAARRSAFHYTGNDQHDEQPQPGQYRHDQRGNAWPGMLECNVHIFPCSH